MGNICNIYTENIDIKNIDDEQYTESIEDEYAAYVVYENINDEQYIINKNLINIYMSSLYINNISGTNKTINTLGSQIIINLDKI